MHLASGSHMDRAHPRSFRAGVEDIILGHPGSFKIHQSTVNRRASGPSLMAPQAPLEAIMFKSVRSVVSSALVLATALCAVACSNNATNDTSGTCPTAGTTCDTNTVQGDICAMQHDDADAVVCCSGTWLAGLKCPAPPADSGPPVTTDAGSGNYADGAITPEAGPVVEPPPDGYQSWCGTTYRNFQVTWAGIPANGPSAQRGAWGSPVILGSPGDVGDFRPWPTQSAQFTNLSTWLEFGQDVWNSTATYVQNVKICTGYSLELSAFDHHTDDTDQYSPSNQTDDHRRVQGSVASDGRDAGVLPQCPQPGTQRLQLHHRLKTPFSPLRPLSHSR